MRRSLLALSLALVFALPASTSAEPGRWASEFPLTLKAYENQARDRRAERKRRVYEGKRVDRQLQRYRSRAFQEGRLAPARACGGQYSCGGRPRQLSSVLTRR